MSHTPTDNTHTVVQVSKERWQEAQRKESEYQQRDNRFAATSVHWFREHFEDFGVLKSFAAKHCLEVGCGKYTNTRVVIRYLPEVPEKLYFEDPLIREYFTAKKRYFRYLKIPGPSPLKQLIDERGEYTAAPLEDLPWKDGMMDLVICMNVLDHVMDFERCMSEMQRVLRPGGALLLAQDLSNDEDFARCPESWADTMHPIKIDHEILDSKLTGYEPLFKKLLSREEGLNPAAHYGTYFFIGTKK